jgi:hypothetical protein
MLIPHENRVRGVQARQIGLAVALVGMLSCGGRNVGPSLARTNAPGQQDATIVWWRVGESYHSAWIEPAEAGFRTRAEREEAVIASTKGLWALRKRFAARVSLCPSCDCLLGEATTSASCRPLRESVMVHAFVRLADDAVVRPTIDPFDANEESCTMTEYEPVAELEASVGAKAVLVLHTYVNGCGAHGMYSDAVQWFDLDRGAVDSAPRPPEDGREALLSAARAQLVEEAGECIDATTVEVSFYATHFSYHDAGAPTLAYEFTAPSSYACGTGPGHYRVATRLESSDLPPSLAEYATVQHYVESFLAKLPKGANLGGVSRVDPAFFPEYTKPPS